MERNLCQTFFKVHQKLISSIDISIILQFSANDFQVITKRGNQQQYKKLKQIRCEVGCTCEDFAINQSWSRHFSHVTKSRIFKNLNLRKKADRNFRRTFLKNRFRHLKLYSNPPSWLPRGRCHMGTFWKTKDWSSHFWEGQPFRFWYVECHRQRRLKSTKTGISS